VWEELGSVRQYLWISVTRKLKSIFKGKAKEILSLFYGISGLLFE